MTIRLASLVIGVALVAAVPASATGQSFYTACTSPLMRLFNNASCEATITNLVTELMSAPHPDMCLPRGFRPPQGIPAVEAWMQRHPEGTMRSENNIVYEAMLDAYPCALPH
jgi:Rap1a immunity proteins